MCLVILLERPPQVGHYRGLALPRRPQHPAAALTHPRFRCFLCFVLIIFFPCVCVNLDFAPGAFAALGEARRWFKLRVLRATVIERRMVVGAGWSPWRHPDPSPCLSAHSDKWLHTGQMGLLSPTHSSLDARGTGQHSSTHHSSSCFNLAALSNNKKQRNATSSLLLASNENPIANLCTLVLQRRHTTAVPLRYRTGSHETEVFIFFSLYLKVFWQEELYWRLLQRNPV